MKRNITRRTLTVALACLMSIGTPMVAMDAVAQDGGQVTIDARYCRIDPEDAATPWSEACTEAGAGAEFTMTQTLPDGDQTDTMRADDAGQVVFPVDAGAESVTIIGPVFAFAGDQPSVRFACRDQDPDDPQVFESRGIGVSDLQGSFDLTCVWYVRETAGEPSAWEGGFTDLVPGVYPEGVVALYGAGSDYPEVSATVEIPYWDAGGVELVLTGIDDELDAPVDMEVLVNGNSVFAGPSAFPKHVPELDAPGSMSFDVPAEYLGATTTITVRNLEPDANFGLPPWLQVREIIINPT